MSLWVCREAEIMDLCTCHTYRFARQSEQEHGSTLLEKGPEHRISLGSLHGGIVLNMIFSFLTSKPWETGVSCDAVARCAFEEALEKGNIKVWPGLPFFSSTKIAHARAQLQLFLRCFYCKAVL